MWSKWTFPVFLGLDELSSLPDFDLREDLNPFPPFSDMTAFDGDRDQASEEEESVSVASNGGDGNNRPIIDSVKWALTGFYSVNGP